MSIDHPSDRFEAGPVMEAQPETTPRSREDAERAAAIRRAEERERAAAAGRPRPESETLARTWSAIAAQAFARLADNVRDYAIFLMDPEGTIIFWGEGARLMKWWSKDQAEGAHLRMLYPSGGSQDGTADAHLQEAAARGEYTGEGERVRTDGSTFWAGITLTALRGADGRLLGFAKVTRDLTARRAADELLQAASVAAEAARADAVATSAAKSGFLATISHEIRTPLNAILGYHDLLDLEVDGPLTPVQRGHLERAQSSGRHLLALVNEVLDFSRIEAQGERVSASTFRVGDAVRGALELVLPQARSTRISITDAVSGYAAGLAAWGDEQRVRQILINLLANAIKFTLPRGGEPGRVTVSAGAAKEPTADVQASGDGPWVYIRVEDTGRGIRADQQRSVFEPFVQGDMTLTRQYGGTGLGLAISRRLARLMGGDLTVRSEPDMGSTFFLWLPAAPVESLASGGVQGHGPGGDQRASADDEPARETAVPPTMLRTIGDIILAELEGIMREFVSRVRADPATASARAVDAYALEDHLATFLADVAVTMQSMTLDDAPSAEVRDGTAIQRFVAQRHGVQRARLGWSEQEVRREFVILDETLAAAVHRRLATGAGTPSPESGAGEAGRAGVLLRHAIRIAEGISLESYRHQRTLLEQERERA
jgi:PAS domain S-box-containing protein